MPFAFAGAAAARWQQLADSLQMSIQNAHFLVFLPVVVGAYFLLPVKLRKAWLLLASYYFYFFAAPQYLWVLLAGTAFSYGMGRVVAAATTRRGKNAALFVGVAGSVLALAFFKYNGFFARFLSPLYSALGISLTQITGYFTTVGALGISFYTFMAIGYLIDVHRGDVPAQKNLATYALFLGFFPAVSQGPISRAGVLMPQLENHARKFNTKTAADALRLMAVGFFKKLAVADTLALFTSAVYGNSQALAGYTGLTLLLAAVCYALQLYFDFSGYSDIALGAAGLLGIQLPQNFNTPYFATNFSGFWARWHISLSTWLQDYIFTPLVWSRWTEKLPLLGKRVKGPPVLSSIIIVFMVSGIWHGNNLCFVVWGALQAAYRVGEEVLHRTLGKPKKRPPLASRIGKTAVVLVLWVESLVFFVVGAQTRGGGVGAALSAIFRQFRGWSIAQTGQDFYNAIWNGFYNQRVLVLAFIAFMVFCLALALWADWLQAFKLKGKSLVVGVQMLRAPLRWLVYFVVVACCFAAFIAQSGGYGGTNFLYGGF